MASAPRAGSRKQKQKPIGHHAKLCWLISRWCVFKAALQCAWSRTTASLSMAADTHWWLHSTRPSLTTDCTVWFENSHHCAAGQQCYTEKATKAWHHEGTQQDKEHLQSTQTTVNRHSSQTKDRPYQKSSPRGKSLNTNQYSNRWAAKGATCPCVEKEPSIPQAVPDSGNKAEEHARLF